MDKYCRICHNISCSNHGKNISFLGDEWKCNYIPVPTNADRIRAMSDEELSSILSAFCHGIEDCVDCPLYDISCPLSSAYEDWVKWVQQPINKGG